MSDVLLPRPLADARKQRTNAKRVSPRLAGPLVESAALGEFAFGNRALLKVLPLLGRDASQP